MVKGRKRSLVYSDRPPFNAGVYNIGIYVNGFECVVRVLCKTEIEQARERITIGKNGHYSYTPSDEYIRALALNKLKR